MFIVGQVLSFTGYWMQKAAVGWLVWELTHSPGWVGAIALCDLLAAIWVAPLSGAVTDRSNPFKLILSTQLMLMSLSVILWGVMALGGATIWFVFAFALIDATLQGFNQPARMVVVGALATPERMSQAVATSSMSVNLARSIGPAIAGLIILRGSISDVILVNVACYVVTIGTLVFVRHRIDRPAAAGKTASIIADIASGFSYISRTPHIAIFFVLTGAFGLLARPFTELFPALAGDVFKGGPDTLAMLMSAQGIGSLVGGLIMLVRRDNKALARIWYGAAFGIGLTLVVFSATSNIVLAVCCMAAAGLFNVTCNIAMQSLAQLRSAPAMRGRVLALYALMFRCGPSLGAFIIGIAAHALPLQILIGGAAAGFLLVVCLMLPRAKHMYGPIPEPAE